MKVDGQITSFTDEVETEASTEPLISAKIEEEDTL